MNAKDLFRKLGGGYLWGNLIAMAVVVVLLFLGVKYGLELYTNHGECIIVPNVKGMSYNKAYRLINDDGLIIQVSDSGYNKTMPPDCILAQTPGYGAKVKSGHVVYVTVNSPSSPTFAIPDIVDNSSLREAEAKLAALGFHLLPPKEIVGEKDWVYGIISRGRRVGTGDRVSTDAPLTLIVGSGGFEGEEDGYENYSDIKIDDGEGPGIENTPIPAYEGVEDNIDLNDE
jgi:beta-lactam-binding protein with PASTA domain